MVEYAKKNPGKLTYGSSGNGTVHPPAAGDAEDKTGIDILHVPYRGGADTLNDVLPGTVHMMNEPVVAAARQGRQADPAQHQRPRAASRTSRTCRR